MNEILSMIVVILSIFAIVAVIIWEASRLQQELHAERKKAERYKQAYMDLLLGKRLEVVMKGKGWEDLNKEEVEL